MPCYILRAGDTDMVKIGWADNDVEARRRLLQTAHWEDLTTIRVVDGQPWVERAMHRRFVERCVRREWYRFDPEMLTFTPEASEAPKGPRSDTREATLRICELFGGQSPLSKLLGLSAGAASEWVSSGFVPYRRIVQIIELGRTRTPPIVLDPNDFFVAPASAEAA